MIAPQDDESTSTEPRALSPEARERLREAIAYRRVSQSDLARGIGVGATLISEVLNGKRDPILENALAMMLWLRVNPGWIVCGVEPKYLDEKQRESSRELLPVNLTGAERWILDTAESITQQERAFLRAVPFPHPEVQQPDVVYQMVLTAYRQALANKPDQDK